MTEAGPLVRVQLGEPSVMVYKYFAYRPIFFYFHVKIGIVQQKLRLIRAISRFYRSFLMQFLEKRRDRFRHTL